jgi:DNA repair protein RadC
LLAASGAVRPDVRPDRPGHPPPDSTSKISRLRRPTAGPRLALSGGVSLSIPASERPRERLLRHGPTALRDCELIAAVLGTGPPSGGALAVAEALLARFQSLPRLAGAGLGELADVPGVGVAQACRIQAALALASRLSGRPFARGDVVRSADDVCDRLGGRLRMLDHEVFLALALDSKNRLLAEYEVATGGTCSVELVPRDVFARAVRERAVAIILVHNHPSGDPAPSGGDDEVTARLVEIGRILGVRVVDHVIVAERGFHSFHDHRVMPGGP